MSPITHLLANIRTYAAMVVLIGGAITAQGLLHGTLAADLATAVAIAGAIATPPPRNEQVTADTARRQE